MRRALLLSLLVACTAGCATLGVGGREKGTSLVPAGPAGRTDAAGRPRRFALLVGIDQFADARFQSLRYAAADARALAAGLEGYDEVVTLTEPDRTDRASILGALEHLARAARDPRDTVFVYFSTHGTLATRPGGALERFLATADTQLDRVSRTGLSVDELVHTLHGLRARRVALVLAACHSGAGKSALPDALAEALARQKGPPPLAERSEALLLFAASAFGEAARESDQLGHDVYTHFLLEALREGDRDGDGAVTATEAHDWARARTYAFTNGAQRPSAELEVLGDDPVVLRGTRSRPGRPVLYGYSPAAQGVRVMVDGVSKGVLPGGVVLDAGPHAFELRDDGTEALLFRGQVVLAPGEAVELSRLLPRPLQVTVALEGGAGLLAPRLSEWWPAQGGGALRLQVGGGALGPLRLAVGVGGRAGRGSQSAFGAPYAFELRALGVDAAAGWALPLGTQWTVVPALVGRATWAERSFPALQGSEAQGAQALGVAARLGVEWAPAESLRLGARLDLGPTWARFGTEQGPYASADAGLWVGWQL